MASVGISAGSGAISGALSGGLATGGNPVGILVGAAVGAILGAAVGAAEFYLNQPPKSNRHGDDIITTTQVRNRPVGICYGRNRLGGNWIQVGNFWRIKDNLGNTPGRRLRVLNGVLALCEGQIQALGNIRQDGQTLAQANRQEGDIGLKTWYRYDWEAGGPAQTLPALMSDPKNGYQGTLIPYQNTAIITCHTIVGTQERLPNVNVDVMGPDYTIAQTGTTSEDNPLDVAGYGFYDSFTGCFYYTLTSSAAAGPYGLVRVGRTTGIREHTPSPVGVTTIKHGWYLGKHDVLLMQDPTNSSQFYIGYWGIDPGSADWEAHQPKVDSGGAGYEHPILVWHLDEAHGILHTLHDSGQLRYILRWTLLTGRIERTETDLPIDTYTAMMYSPDRGCYLVTSAITGLSFVDQENGTTFMVAAGTLLAACAAAYGICVSGQLVGVIAQSGCHYFDTQGQTVIGIYGNGDPSVNLGGLGATFAHQNTYSGHVTLTKSAGGSAAFVNFIPSIVEDVRDIDANGTSALLSMTSDGTGDQPADGDPDDGTGFDDDNDGDVWEPDFQTFQAVGLRQWPPADPVYDWVRDWSYRTYNSYSWTALQGNSSLAAAMWHTMVNQATASGGNSSRYAAGLDIKYFDIGSFEGLHAYCVGAMSYANPPVNGVSTSRWAERYKFDYFLDGETFVSQLVNDHMLVACQGFRLTIGGIFRVGVLKPGVWPIWHFTDATFAGSASGQSSFKLSFLGRSQGINRVRVQYRNVLNEYQHDYAEVDDEWDINARGRVQMVTVNAEGCGRFGQAEVLAKAVLDQSPAGRRQATFDTHFVGWLISPGDPIEVSNAQCALSQVKMVVASINERSESGTMEISALEHLSAATGPGKAPPEVAPPGVGVPPNPVDNCLQQQMSTDGTINWFNTGAAYAPGVYRVTYRSGAYAPTNDGTWKYTVAGADIVTVDSVGNLVVLTPAPAVSIAAPGWATREDAEAANAGQTATFTLLAAGPIGIRRQGGVVSYDADASTNPPMYEVCTPGTSGG